MNDSVCIKCGQCINVCPTASLIEKKNINDVLNALRDPDKHVVVQVAPAIRAAIGEGFDNPAGTPVTGTVEGTKLNLVIANGLHNAKIVMERIKQGNTNWHLIEIMACPGGCIAGGGQPMADVARVVYPMDEEIIKKRASATYKIDEKMKLRKSHENPEIINLYKDFLGDIGGKKSHDLLHTSYAKRLPKGIN